MILVFLCTFSTLVFAQYNVQWDQFYGGDNFDELNALIEVDDGIVYGGTAGSSTAGDPPPTAGNADYWIFKTDFDGNIIWSYTYGGSNADILINIIRTQDGGFMAIGFSFSDTSGFKSQDSRGERDFWIVKLDENGLFEWDATYGGDAQDFPTSILQVQDGSYYIGGFTESRESGEVSFPTRGGRFDYWLCHIDSNGSLIYDRRFGGPNDDLMDDMIELSNGDLVLAGFSNSNMGGEKSDNSFGGNDAWIIRMTPTGNIVWDRIYGGAFDDRSASIIESSPNELFVGGFSSSLPSGNKTAPNIGGADYWLLNINFNGDLIWDRTYGGTGQDELTELQINDKGILYLGGRSSSEISVDKTESNRGFWDYWLIVTDDNDIVYYDKTLGGDQNDLLRDFLLLEQGGLVAGGFSLSDTSGDITDMSNGLQDALVFFIDCTLDNFLDLGQDDMVCPDTEVTLDASINQPNICTFLWDDGSTEAERQVIVSQATDYMVTVTDIFGCLAIDTMSFTTLDAPVFDLGPNLIICEDDIATLDATDPNCPTCTYLWDDNSTNPIREVVPAFSSNYQVAVTNDINCTTTDDITVNVLAKSTVRINNVTCIPEEARNDTIIDTNQFGCDSLTIFNIVLLPSDTLRFVEGVCDPDSVGRDTIFDINFLGCDSLSIFTYFLNPSNQTNISDETCDETMVGIDTMFLSNEFGCDSLVITEFSLLPSSNVTETFLSCDPDEVGRDTMVFTNQFGCDSILIYVTDPLLSDTTRINEPVCFLNELGQDTLILTNEVGCDSLVITIPFFVSSDTIVTLNFTCDPAEVRNDSVVINNPTGCDTLLVDIVNLVPSSEDTELIFTCDVNQALRDTIFETNIFGCDSIIYREFQILESDTIRLDGFVCDAPAFNDTLFLLNANGCDSLVITSFAEATSDDLFFNDMTCDESLEGIQVFTLVNQFGCDSTITIDYELVEAQVTIVEENTCDPAQFMPDTLIFSTDLCDSIVIINYNVQMDNGSTVDLVSCDPADVGQFITILTNQQGCDSVVTQIVQFSEVDSNFVKRFECSRLDTLIEEFNFTNQFGCDSIVVQTTVPGLDTTFILSNVCEAGDAFKTEEMFTSVEGCDSIVVSIGSLSETFETTFEIFTCDEDLVGTDIFNFTSVEGCDSVIIFNTILGEINIDATIRDIPCGESNTGQVVVEGNSGQLPYLYNFDGSAFGTENIFENLAIGTYQVGVQDADGCESFTEVEVSEVTGVEIILPDFVQIEFGDPVILNPTINGDFTEFFWSGIDSLFCESCLDQNYIPLTSTVINLNVLSIDGCLEKHQVNIAVAKNYDVYIPNAFSPNGDNINDFFMVFGEDNIASILSLNIYDRWGEQLFSGENLEPNNELSGWDGTNRGKSMNPGIFMYSIQVQFVDGEVRRFEGDLSLIR